MCLGTDFLACLTGSASETFFRSFEQGTDDTSVAPVEQLRGKRIQDCSSGRSHYGVVTSSGQLLMWGSNSDMQCGGAEYTEYPWPTQVLPEAKCVVRSLSCGYTHSLAVTDEGVVLSWGGGEMGKLGHGGDGEARRAVVSVAFVFAFAFCCFCFLLLCFDSVHRSFATAI